MKAGLFACILILVFIVLKIACGYAGWICGCIRRLARQLRVASPRMVVSRNTGLSGIKYFLGMGCGLKCVLLRFRSKALALPYARYFFYISSFQGGKNSFECRGGRESASGGYIQNYSPCFSRLARTVPYKALIHKPSTYMCTPPNRVKRVYTNFFSVLGYLCLGILRVLLTVVVLALNFQGVYPDLTQFVTTYIVRNTCGSFMVNVL